MTSTGFDREWQLVELLDESGLEKIGPALAGLLGGDVAILDDAGTVVWGVLSAAPRREPLVLELEPVGYLASATAARPALAGGRFLLEMLLRIQARYKMASNLHLEAVAEDFESLRREHARLQESEARYKTLAGELEARVAAQVAQLEERQQMLYQAEKLASVGQLAAGVAHEINNPLGFVRSNLSTFERYLTKVQELKPRLSEGDGAWRALDLDFILEDAVDLLGDSSQGLDRIARIVSDLKSFSNVDRASVVLSDLNDCLRHAAGAMEGMLPAGVRLHLDLQPLPGLVCLPGHLNQIFLSLLLNASQAIVDAGREGDIRVVSEHCSEGDRTGLQVRISDNGIGMTPEQMARVFEPFYTTRPVGAGAGLGLSTARNIVQAHSGDIALQSQPDIGTTVTLFIPLPK